MAVRNDSGRGGGSQERDFGHSEQQCASKNRNELD
jgi:hypothetical protein